MEFLWRAERDGAAGRERARERETAKMKEKDGECV